MNKIGGRIAGALGVDPSMTRRQRTDMKHAQNKAYNASVNAGMQQPPQAIQRPVAGNMPQMPQQPVGIGQYEQKQMPQGQSMGIGNFMQKQMPQDQMGIGNFMQNQMPHPHRIKGGDKV